MISVQDILNARERIQDYITVTPLDFSMGLSTKTMKIYLKLECQQKMKSFKTRGVLSKMTSLTNEEKKKGVTTISSGNHGAGMSYASSLLDIQRVKIFVPETTPLAKVKKINYYGAEVVQVGRHYDETHKIAMEIIQEEKLTFIDSCSDTMVIAGQGTIGLEILEQNPDIDVIVVPIGGGGIITGISIAAKHINPNIQVIGVQPTACPAMVKSLEDKTCYLEYPSEESLCDALVGGVGEIPYKMAAQCIDDIIVVDEVTIKQATAMLLTEEKVVAEPSSATGVAAIMLRQELFEGKNVAIVITGGNLDPALMKRLLTE
ncbi:Pyridoxal-5'-phosphate-dependent protein, beta subunit [Alkaliphilus metalliredigens QYMF]|uniref:threonine ammonia-lyase n=1 Tax=Alkaliphilus metalliredigens (strain QYMF) TaxID=293826 RepID=A6TKP9_ALKMQ|nr:threonine/serine dehydratase [Alkaliphilus metalliredigens]ABR46767.1 Pyridoxal-5'-phosphate-dependent protein, beta subunit [Alkaliphilus metalliredigens QYMF]